MKKLTKNQKQYILLKQFINEAIKTNTSISYDPEKEKEFLNKLKDLDAKNNTDMSKDIVYNDDNKYYDTIRRADFNKLKNKDKISQEELNKINTKQYSIEDINKHEEKILSMFKTLFHDKINSTPTKNSPITKIKARFENNENAKFYLYHIATNINIAGLVFKLIKKFGNNKKIEFDTNNSENFVGEYQSPNTELASNRLYMINLKNLGGETWINHIVDFLIKYQIMYQESLQEKDNKNSILNYSLNTPNKNWTSKLKNFLLGAKINFKQFLQSFKENKNTDIIFDIIKLFENIKENYKENPDSIIILNYGTYNSDEVEKAENAFLSRTPWMMAHRLFDNSVKQELSEEANSLFKNKIISSSKYSLNSFLRRRVEIANKHFFNFINSIENFKSKPITDITYNEFLEIEKAFNNKYPEIVDYPRISELDHFDEKTKQNKKLTNISLRYLNCEKKLSENLKFFQFEQSPKGLFLAENYIGLKDNLNINFGECNLFRFQKFNTNYHKLNYNTDIINEIMVYYMGRIVRKEGNNFIVNINRNNEQKNIKVDSKNLSKLIFNEKFISAYNQDEDFNNFLNESFTDLIVQCEKIIEETLNLYKGKLLFMKL